MTEENHEKTSVRLVGTGIRTRDLPNASLVRYHVATSLGKKPHSGWSAPGFEPGPPERESRALPRSHLTLLLFHNIAYIPVFCISLFRTILSYF